MRWELESEEHRTIQRGRARLVVARDSTSVIVEGANVWPVSRTMCVWGSHVKVVLESKYR